MTYPCGTIYRDVAQGTPAWHEIKLGKVSASRLADMLAETKQGWGASRANYMAELVIERMTKRPVDRYKSGAMAFGNENEDAARQAYIFKSGYDYEQVAFVDHPTIEGAGCSPDMLVGPDGLAEIKAPGPATHIATLRGKTLPGVYFKQVQFQMACTGRAWCDWLSWCPEMPPEMRLFKQRIERNNTLIAQYEAETRVFIAELEKVIAELRQQYPEAA